MVRTKSLEYSEVFSALLCDVQTLHCDVLTTSELKKTLNKVNSRISYEGLSFLTKTLPRLGKAFDKVLAGQGTLCATKLGFRSRLGSQLPMLFGELFSKVLSPDGAVLHNADVACIKDLRALLFLFYKLELPYDPKLELNVINKFVKTEDEVRTYSIYFGDLAEEIDRASSRPEPTLDAPTFKWDALRAWGNKPQWFKDTVRRARYELFQLFRGFDPKDIYPRHGPGAVSTRERLEGKYTWTNVPRRIAQTYPLDAYFYASVGHVCDAVSEISHITDDESFAKVVLVPKDSRGPRLISCEPLEFQWVQQGLGRAIVRWVEHNPLTRENVRFTDQEPNRMGALAGSWSGKYATLDLNEASDRVSLGLVRLLFPGPLIESLLAVRSLGTRLPDGRLVKFHKYAPMGSALCFPVLALTVWSLLKSGFETLGIDTEQNHIYVYGDDVIVPTAYAEHAMNILMSFGLKINQDKSCTRGSFRESCGMDAYAGVPVTPLRIRTEWTSYPRPESYASYIAYANEAYDRKYYNVSEYIGRWLCKTYGPIPSWDLGITPLSLKYVPEGSKQPRVRYHSKSAERFQRPEWLVREVCPVTVKRPIDGWKMLLRFFSEACSGYETAGHANAIEQIAESPLTMRDPFSVSVYTERRRSKLRWCWRG